MLQFEFLLNLNNSFFEGYRSRILSILTSAFNHYDSKLCDYGSGLKDYQGRNVKLMSENKSLKAEISALSLHLEESNSEVDLKEVNRLKKSLSKRSKQVEVLIGDKKKLSTSFEKKESDFKEQIASFKKDINLLNLSILDKESSILAFSEVEQKNSYMLKELSALNDNIKSLSEKNNLLEQNKSSLEKKLRGLKDSSSCSSDEFLAVKKDLTESKNTIVLEKQKNHELSNCFNLIKADCDNKNREISFLKEYLHRVQCENFSLSQQNSFLTQNLSSSSFQLSNERKSIVSMDNHYTKIIEAKDQEILNLKSQLASNFNNISRSNSAGLNVSADSVPFCKSSTSSVDFGLPDNDKSELSRSID